MIVTRLKLANLRVNHQAAEFRFQPGFNLIVGVNGVGKTTVQDALGVCLSAMVKVANKLRDRFKKLLTSMISVSVLTLLLLIAASEICEQELQHPPTQAA